MARDATSVVPSSSSTMPEGPDANAERSYDATAVMLTTLDKKVSVGGVLQLWRAHGLSGLHACLWWRPATYLPSRKLDTEAVFAATRSFGAI